ncbi:hypothetical protein V6M85_07980 [Sulfolobus tengchongensis]|uniref:Uncharacterized protein n=1 Tax=Sulfolobus tengchongensis TaxID=207809 RepID=A0AAX4KX97_9CREN
MAKQSEYLFWILPDGAKQELIENILKELEKREVAIMIVISREPAKLLHKIRYADIVAKRLNKNKWLVEIIKRKDHLSSS